MSNGILIYYSLLLLWVMKFESITHYYTPKKSQKTKVESQKLKVKIQKVKIKIQIKKKKFFSFRGFFVLEFSCFLNLCVVGC